MTFHVQVFLVSEDDVFVAYCPALELSSYGDSIEDARHAFGEAMQIFVHDTQAKGTLEKELLKLGWKLQQRPIVNYEPPSPPIDFLNTMGQGKQIFQTVSQPMHLEFA